MTLVYGWYSDISDELVANSTLTLEQMVDLAVETGKRRLLQQMLEADPARAVMYAKGELFVRFLHKHERHTVDPFDYEDEDSVMQHSEGYECWRVLVEGNFD